MKLEDQGRLVGGVYAGGGFILPPAAQKGVGQGGTGDLGPAVVVWGKKWNQNIRFVFINT